MFIKRHQNSIISIDNFKERLDSDGLFGVSQTTIIAETKYKEKVLIYYPEKFDDSLQIRMFVGTNRNINLINLIFRGNNMDIADLQVLGRKNISKGYGSVLIEKALSIAKEKGVKTVTGIIVSDNENHRHRQVKFYTLYGFTIEGNKLKLEL